jgi:hypothetical protein
MTHRPSTFYLAEMVLLRPVRLFDACCRFTERKTPDRRLGESGGAGATLSLGRIEPIAMAPGEVRIA